MLIPILILPYYSVIGGWVIKYMTVFLTGQASAAADSSYFGGFIGQTASPLWMFFIFVTLTIIIVAFGVEKGESLGLIGLNGSGKSTMLKIIAGVLKPTKGSVKVNGTVAPLIELGAGFDFDLTAKENVFLNGALLGHSREFMQSQYEDIVEFSELREFMDVPVKNFSSGMVSRLAFAIATVGTPDILIVDEVLSVGDYHFQQKCETRINHMKEQGTTILFVSHSMEQVKNMCSKIIWLERGRIRRAGLAEEVCREYQNL